MVGAKSGVENRFISMTAKNFAMLVLFVVIQTAGGVWWVASANARVNSLEVFQKQSENMPERVAKLEAHYTDIKDSLTEIKSILEKRP